MTDEPVIVVVEDDPNIADLIELYLRRDGFRVHQAADGDPALRTIRDRRPRLVICAFANVAPELFVGLVEAAQSGDLARAAELHRRVLLLTTLGAYSDPAIGAIKVAMRKLGVPISPAVRGPALPATDEKSIESVLKDTGLLPVTEEV